MNLLADYLNDWSIKFCTQEENKQFGKNQKLWKSKN